MMKEPFLVFLQNQYQNTFVYMKTSQSVGWESEDSSVVFTSHGFYGAGINSLPWSIPVCKNTAENVKSYPRKY